MRKESSFKDLSEGEVANLCADFETKVYVIFQDWKEDIWYAEYPDFDSAIRDLENSKKLDEVKGIVDNTEPKSKSVSARNFFRGVPGRGVDY